MENKTVPWSRDKILGIAREIEAEAEQIKPYVIICQPRRDEKELAAQKLDGYHFLQVNFDGFSRAFTQISGEKVDVARNVLMERAIESGAKYMIFIGEDTVLPFDGWLKLHETAEANPGCMVVGVYYVKMSVPMIMIKKDNVVVPANVEPGQIIECQEQGLDCAVIPIEILKKMKADAPDVPFCCIIPENLVDGIPFIGEDNFFNYRLRKAGFRTLCNTDVQCLHMDLASGKFTAHPSVNLDNYFTQIPVTERLTFRDKMYIDKRWIDRIPGGKDNPLPETKTDSGHVDKDAPAVPDAGGEK